MLLVCGSAHGTGDAPAGPDTVSSLIEQHGASTLDREAAYKAAKSKVTKAINKERGTEGEAEGLLWMLRQSWWEQDKKKAAGFALDALAARHMNSPALADIINVAWAIPRDRASDFYAAMTNSESDAVKAAGHYLAGKTAASSRDKNARSQAVTHFNTVRQDYSDLEWNGQTFGDLVGSYMQRHSPRMLAVGQKAPEIIGADMHGEEMRLSQFQGQVVLLDFFGDW